jgi:hypothetical protein
MCSVIEVTETMASFQDPGDPDPQLPPKDDEQPRSPFERPPFDEDPEAQHAPGDSEQGLETPPPMQATEAAATD